MRVLGWFQKGGMVRFMMVLFFLKPSGSLATKVLQDRLQELISIAGVMDARFQAASLLPPPKGLDPRKSHFKSHFGSSKCIFFLHLFTSFLGSALVCCLGRLVKREA